MTDQPLRFYYRENCHLCETLVAVLHRGWPGLLDKIEWCDIDSRADWQTKYGLQVPVLFQGEQQVCELQADIGRLIQHFGQPVNSLY